MRVGCVLGLFYGLGFKSSKTIEPQSLVFNLALRFRFPSTPGTFLGVSDPGISTLEEVELQGSGFLRFRRRLRKG